MKDFKFGIPADMQFTMKTGGTVPDPTVVHGVGITRIVGLTQAEYDALDPPDSNTLYVIREEVT
ncbi:MAG: hypothetical protein K2I93_07955 [Oscillospiraceae bacterium]|nr:hypothetical protein [Oscillospiraceae bacterium]